MRSSALYFLLTVFVLSFFNTTKAQQTETLSPIDLPFQKEDLIGKSMEELIELGYINERDTSRLPANNAYQERYVDCFNPIIPVDPATWTPFTLDPASIRAYDDGFEFIPDLGFDFEYCGNIYDFTFLNINGALSFDSDLNTYTPDIFPNAGIIALAPFWADVDITACGEIWYQLNSNHLIVSWVDVGYYDENCDLRNTFQIIISDGTAPIIGIGNNVEFRYGDMNWTTGAASGGVGGFGGSAATIGHNAGDGVTYEQAGSFDQDNSNYDGPAGADDGIHWLDFKCFNFDVSGAGFTLDCTVPFTSVSLDASCTASIDPTTLVTVNGGVCSNVTLTPNIVNFTCADLGPNPVTITATSTTDVQTCISTINVLQGACAPPSINPVGPFCDSDPSVILTASPLGGSWGGAAPGGVFNPNTAGPGVHTVTYTVPTACPTTATMNITVNSGPLVTIFPDPASFCTDVGSIPIVATAVGGTGGYTYNWTTPTGLQVGSSIIAPQQGTYTVTVSDGSGCSSEETVNVTELNPDPISFVGPTAFCNDLTNAQLLALPAGGTWSGTYVNPTGVIFPGSIPPGTIQVTYTYSNAFGCTSTHTQDIVINETPDAIASNNGPVCTGSPFSLQGSTSASGPVTYSWIGPGGFSSTQQNPTNATLPGNYILVVSANGCSSLPATTTVSFLPLPIALANNTGPYCPGEPISLIGNTPSSGLNISYQWSGPGGFSSTQQNPTNATLAGTYTFTVTIDGCTSLPVTTNVSISTPPSAIANNTGPYCEGDPISLQGFSAPSTGSITYSWSGPGGFSSIQQNPTNATLAGTYTLTTTVDGCVSTPGSTDVIINPTPQPIITGDATFCTGSTAFIDAGSGYASYNWSNGLTSQVIPITATGTYTVNVISAAGCPGTASFSVQENPNPTVSITGDDFICVGNSNTLDAGLGFFAYQWSTGSQTQSINVSTSGNYSVTVTDINNCTAEDQITTFEGFPVTPTIIGEPTICFGSVAILEVDNIYPSYLWSDGSTLPLLPVSLAGTYSVTVTDIYGCTGEDTFVLGPGVTPAPVITGDDIICDGASTILDAGTFASYVWSDGSMSQTLNVDATGTYSVTVTSAAGCTGEAQFNVAEAAPLVANITGSNTFCVGSSTTLDAGAGYTYAWSTGDTDQTLEVSSSGNYSVTITDSNNCTAEDMIAISENSSLSPTIAGLLNICDGANSLLDAGAGFDSYLWSDGSSTQTITVGSADIYSVTVTDANGCTGETSVTTVVNPNPVPIITGDDNFCFGTDIVLEVSNTFTSFLWSDGSLNNSISVNAAGTYSVTVTDGNGCTGEISHSVSENTLPLAAITGSTSYCTGSSTLLDAGTGFTYLWSDGTTNQTLEASAPGNYAVTITDSNGCTNEDFVNVIENTSLSPVIGGLLDFCDGESTTLDVGTGFDIYLWSNGSTTSSITVNTSGTYSVTVTDSNGCTGEVSESTTVNPLPVPTINGDDNFCAGTDIMLEVGSTFANYTWSDGTLNNSITVNATGTYTVTVTDGNGCTGETFHSVTANPNPEPTITGDDAFCMGSSVTLDAGSGFDQYDWAGGNATQTLVVTSGNTYVVTVTDSNGCTGETDFEVTEESIDPPSIAGNIEFCEGGNSTLDAGDSYNSYAWSNGSVDQAINVIASGTYTVTVTDISGCSSNAQVDIIVNANPTVDIAGANTFCEGATETLDAGGTFSNYIWSDGSGASTLNVNSNGTYAVTVTDGNGCTAEDDINISVNPNPEPSIAGSSSFCTGSTTTLDVGTGFDSYAWTGGSVDPSLEVSLSGNYSVTVTDVNGCTGETDVDVTESNSLDPAISGNLDFCSGDNTLLDAGIGFSTYTWSDGSTGQTLNVNADGDYSVTVTDANGCTGETTVPVIENQIPDLNITGNDPFCTGDAITLDAGDGLANYEWSNASLNQNILVNVGGTYAVTITDGNGCSNEGQVTVVENANPNPNIIGDQAFCAGDMVTLDAGTFDQFNWSTGATINQLEITTGGTYNVTVTDANGCTGEDQITVSENQNPNPQISGDLEFCEGEVTSLTAPDGFTYDWSTGETGQIITLTTDGLIGLTVTDGNGCIGETTVNLLQNENPIPSIAGSTTFCTGNGTTIDAGSDFSTYLWSDGSLNQTLDVTLEGDYFVTVTNASGCSGEDQISITESSSLEPVIAGDEDICEGETSTFDAGSGFTSYQWSNGAITQSITVDIENTYSVTVSDSEGCSGETSVSLAVNSIPTAIISGVDNFCEDEMSTLNAGDGFASYSWSTGESTQNIEVNSSDAYQVTVVDNNGCQAVASLDVTVNDLPSPVINGPNSFCSGNDATLTLNNTFNSYNWSTGESTASITINAGDTYSITVTTAEGCSAETMQVVTENANLTPVILGDLDFCDGDNSMLDAGSGFASYEWSNGAITQMISVTENGNYNVMVTDADGCSGSTNVTVNTFENPTVVIAGSTTFCAGSSATLDAGNYDSFIWSNGETSSTITVSTPGIYSVDIIDNNGCEGTAEVDVTESSSLNPVISGDNAFCSGEFTTLDAGAGFDSYLWSNGSTNQTIEVSVADDYSVTVSDGSGCDGETSVAVTESIPPSTSFISGPTLCNTDAGGSTTNLFELIDSGDASGTWEDSNNSGASGQYDNLIFTGVAPGIYTFTYTTNSAVSPCEEISYPVEVTILDCGCPGPVFSIPDPLCNSGDILELESVTSSTVDGNWSIITTPVGNNPATLSTTLFDASNADAGEYELAYQLLETPPPGCDDEFYLTINVDQAVTAGVPLMPLDFCADENEMVNLDGLLNSADANGIWTEVSPIPSQSDAFNSSTGSFDINNQTSGIYTFEYALAANGACPGDTESVEVIINELPIAEAGEGLELDCGTPIASLNAMGSSNGTDYYIQWSGGVLIDGNENTIEPNVENGGNYILTITNNLTGCSATDDVFVEESDELPMAIAGVDDQLTCITTQLSLQAGGDIGTGFELTWQGPGINSANANVANPTITQPGVYILNVTDTSNDCESAPDTVFIANNTVSPEVNIEAPQIIDCVTFAVQLSGTASSDNTSFEWITNGDVIAASPVIGDITTPGFYVLLATDADNGCIGSDTIEVIQNIGYPIAAAGLDQTIDCYNPEVTLDGSNSQTGLSIVYTWDGPGLIIPTSNSPLANANQPGVYVLTVVDSDNGCLNVDSIIVDQNTTAPNAEIANPDQLDCTVDEVSLDASGSSTGTSFTSNWINNQGEVLANTLNLNVQTMGTYFLAIQDTENGCVDTASVDVMQNMDIPTTAGFQIEDPECYGDENGVIGILEVQGGTAPYVYSLNDEFYTTSSFYAGLAPGTYNLGLQDANGCEWDTVINLIQPSEININLGADLRLELGDSAIVQAIVNIPYDQIDTVLWTPADLINCGDPNCLEVGFNSFISQNLTVTLIDIYGCEDEAQLRVNLDRTPKIFIPNIFTPNGDGINDLFFINADDEQIEEITQFRVFNRWGELVYEGLNFQPNDPGYGWNGTFRGEPMNPAVFVYLAEIEFIDGRKEIFKGDVTLAK